jgi:hypothetical protein
MFLVACFEGFGFAHEVKKESLTSSFAKLRWICE